MLKTKLFIACNGVVQDARRLSNKASDMPRLGREARPGNTEITWDFETRPGWGLKIGVWSVATLLRQEAKLIHPTIVGSV
jgi:hypothetical protein